MDTVDAQQFHQASRTGGVRLTVKQLIVGAIDNQSLAQGFPPWQL